MQETPKSLIWLRFTAEPRTGRFISRDTYRGERSNADTWHLYLYCANNPINYVDPSGHRKIRISTWITTIAIDSILTICAGWWKWSYDLIGSTLKSVYKRYGLKPVWRKFLGVVPKVTGAYSKFFTKIRTAIWRVTGYTLKIGLPASISNGISKFIEGFRNSRVNMITYILTSLTSMGGAISLALDYLSDNKFDKKITLRG